MQSKPTMSEPCDLQIHINGQQTFVLSEIDDFPGGPDGFELVSRFCYNNGNIQITVSNVSLLHCCAVFLGMTENVSSINLLHQTDVFLEGIFYWSWTEILICLKNCEPFFSCAESCGLIEKLMCSLLAKIAQNSDVNLFSVSSSSTSSSPETGSPVVSNGSSSRKSWVWWFQDLTILSPKFIDHFLRTLGAYGSDNNNLVFTRFLFHYLKTALHSNGIRNNVSAEYSGLADTLVHGVVLMGKNAFSCRRLFWVLRIVSGFGLSSERRTALERMIAGMLDQATLDDLLVSGGDKGGVYDVNLVLRLIRLFVRYNDKLSLHKMKKIGPDPNLKISKFLGVAESLPDFARDSFDQVYRAIEIYLESHPTLSLEERSRLCRCLNYEKLSLEACKDLAKNPRIPPRIAVQALASQRSTVQMTEFVNDDSLSLSSNIKGIDNTNDYQIVLYKHNNDDDRSKTDMETERLSVDKEVMKVNLERMQWRVVELEKVCREMKGQMARMVKLAPQNNLGRGPLPRLC
ncbi:hypothetical protein CDL12_15083 [Handroanthus impetiginosus]|uniref:NPH3 domain-containing protein n=1 Tax=Handroanthus impetiginosus TaxID=429701 RepID=A0A2G9H4S4_9LAMI|nr:hypothetical protein CDL12_15083 [Handroanthus impetiginosus]